MQAMAEAANLPVTVKCRIGVDDQDPRDALFALVEACARAGVGTFVVHARKAWLKGLSPKENRDVPPLDYELVYELKRAYPQLIISLNGGVASLEEAEGHLTQVDGIMLGRAGMDYHFEFTVSHNHPVAPSPTQDDLAVFYMPDERDWQAACDRMVAAGFEMVTSFNPYWDVQGRTYRDPDGYRVVLQNAQWKSSEQDAS